MLKYIHHFHATVQVDLWFIIPATFISSIQLQCIMEVSLKPCSPVVEMDYTCYPLPMLSSLTQALCTMLGEAFKNLEALDNIDRAVFMLGCELWMENFDSILEYIHTRFVGI